MVEPAVFTSSFININGTIVAALLLVACCLLLVACCLLLLVVVVVVVVVLLVVLLVVVVVVVAEEDKEISPLVFWLRWCDPEPDNIKLEGVGGEGTAPPAQTRVFSLRCPFL